MIRILRPAVKLMNKLKYVQKFTLIFIIFLFPIVLMTTSNILQVNNEFEYTKKQRMGLEYSIALRTLIQHVQQHRGLTVGYTNGKKQLKNDMFLNEKEIQKDIKKVDEIEDKYGEVIEVSNEWENIKEEWVSLEKEIDELELGDVLRKHTNLISNMLKLNNRVADKSNLIIQSRLETYYLVDTIVNRLPLTTEYLGQARAIGVGVTTKKSLSKEEKESLILLSQNIKLGLNDAKTGMEIAFHNTQIREKLMEVNNNAFESAIDMVDLINREIVNKDNIQISAEDYFEINTKAIDKIYNLLIAQSEVVDYMSREDVEALAFRRNIIILLTIITILTIIYIFAGFYQSIRGGILAIEIAASKIADGNLSERVQLEAQDETQKIQNALNKMVDTLIFNYKQVSEVNLALEKVAHYDHLTGLINRSLFMEKLNEAICQAYRNGKIIALMFIDLDRFKIINDTLGHQMGDVVLKSVAFQLTGIIGNRGTVCRLGGDEFTILLPKIKNKQEVKILSEKITEVIERPWVLNEEEHSIGASIGYTFYPCEAKDAEEMLRKADMAMYQVKQKRKESYGTEVR